MNEDHDSAGRSLETGARNINPGEWAVDGARPIATLLGSCVAVCLHDPVLRIGGMNHFMLPGRARTAESEYDALLCGDYAMEVLVNAMFDRGARRERLVAKAFGGGNVVSHLRRSIGDGNIEFACAWLEREGIALHASDFGGAWARKVVYDPRGGDAFCRRIDCGQPVSRLVAQAETRYESTLRDRSGAGADDIELF